MPLESYGTNIVELFRGSNIIQQLEVDSSAKLELQGLGLSGSTGDAADLRALPEPLQNRKTQLRHIDQIDVIEIMIDFSYHHFDQIADIDF